MAPAKLLNPENALIVGWDFSTGAVKALAFDLAGSVVAEVRLPTDLWTDAGVSEINLCQLEGQAMASTRALAEKLKDLGRLSDWMSGGISATHHTAGRIDGSGAQVRRAICWNDQTLAHYHADGLRRLGGDARARALTGGPWAVRYSLSHLVKDEQTLPKQDWARTKWMLLHGPLAAGYLTGRFGVTSISSAASTGIMDLSTNQYRKEMLECLADPAMRDWAWQQLPAILTTDDPVGVLAPHVCQMVGMDPEKAPFVYPTLDDQAAGLVGGGATDAGHVAIILGTSAVVNSSSGILPQSGTLDCMKLNWGPYLWMRCYSNGAAFVDHVVGKHADWTAIEAAVKATPAGCGGVTVLPFVVSEPSLGVTKPKLEWQPTEPVEVGVRARAAFEALAYLMALAVKEHEAAGQMVTRVTVSGGLAKSTSMVEILASVLNCRVERLASDEGPALGAAVAAMAGHENQLRAKAGFMEKFTIADAVTTMVKFRQPVDPNPQWVGVYQKALIAFTKTINSLT